MKSLLKLATLGAVAASVCFISRLEAQIAALYPRHPDIVINDAPKVSKLKNTYPTLYKE